MSSEVCTQFPVRASNEWHLSVVGGKGERESERENSEKGRERERQRRKWGRVMETEGREEEREGGTDRWRGRGIL